MSEVMKCPRCKEDPDVLVDLFDKHGKYPKGFSCCGAEFLDADRWNQYAVAMELARVTACDCTESARTHAMAAYRRVFR